MSDTSQPQYRDLSDLVGLLRTSLMFFILIAAVGLWFGWLEIDLLKRFKAGEIVPESDAVASDSRQAIIGGLYFLVFIVTSILFLRWTYLSNRNARALGATGMKFTPGWSAGWYFVPVLWLWKPYQALKETFQASHPEHSEDWQQAPRPGLMPVWWTLWLVSAFIGQAILRSTLSAETVDELLASSWMVWFSDAVDIPLGVLAIVLVSTMYDWQQRKAKLAEHLAGSRQLILDVLHGKITESYQWVFEDDLLFFAIVYLEDHDPEWLYAHLTDKTFSLENRRLAALEVSSHSRNAYPSELFDFDVEQLLRRIRT